MNGFACALNCMDGRVQMPVIKYMQKNFDVEFVDMVTRPGINGILAKRTNLAGIERIKSNVLISVLNHGSKVVSIVGHAECAGNPGDKEMHIRHLIDAKKTVESFGLPIHIPLLWIGNDWTTVQEIEIPKYDFSQIVL